MCDADANEGADAHVMCCVVMCDADANADAHEM
jgi:hypothetical protein